MPPGMIRTEPWFILPGVQEYYYTKNHPTYRLEPPFMDGCAPNDTSPVSWIYPKSDSPIIIPRNLTGENERTVLKASHRNPQATLYWHLNEEYLGETRTIHEMEIVPEPGEHVVTIVDHNGNSISRKLKIIRSN
jgi:penicillin-binding protein 1C